MRKEVLISLGVLTLFAGAIFLVGLLVPFEPHQRSAGEPFRYSGTEDAQKFGTRRGGPAFNGFDMDAERAGS